MKQIAHHANERWPDTETDQVHDKQKERAGQNPLVRTHLVLNQGDGRGKIEIVQQCKTAHEQQGHGPGGRKDEAQKKRRGPQQG